MLALLVGGCASASPVAQHDAVPAQEMASGAPVGTPVPAPAISITPTDGAADVALDQPVSVSVDTGVLDAVTVHSDGDPTPLPGTTSHSGRLWQATSTLDPGVHYLVQATAHDSGGSSTAQAAFTTLRISGRLTTDVTPADGSTVGVGMPIILQFNVPVAADRQASLLSHIQVQTSPAVLGDWHWFSEREVHWRPRDLWPSGTQVNVVANLRGVGAGNNIWGMGDWSSAFTVGPKHYSVIDAATHTMQVYDGDKLIHTYPVSTGVDNKWPTLSGTLFVWYKLQKLRMVSTSIGIPVNAPGGYDEDVFWDTAISTDGFFVHAAPWSVWAQGSRNVSHGCVNLSTARAIEFYNFSRPGDVVVVKNTIRPADASDGEADWQIPWEKWANSGGQTAASAPAASSASGGGI